MSCNHKTEDFFKTQSPIEKLHGINPPYGELDIQMQSFYSAIGDTLNKTTQEQIVGLLHQI